MSSFRALSKDIVQYGIMGGLSRSVNLLLLPILTRIFSPAEYGTIDVIATVTALLAMVMTVSLESAVARLWLQSKEDGTRALMVSSVLGFVGAFGAAVVMIASYYAGAISRMVVGAEGSRVYIVLAAWAALMLALSAIPQMVLRMERRILLYNVLHIVRTLSYVLLALLLAVPWGMGLTGIFAAQLLANGLALVCGLVLTARYLTVRISRRALSDLLAYSLPLFPSVLALWISTQADRIIMLSLLGLSAVGVFGVAEKIAAIVGLMSVIFTQAWMPLSVACADEPSGRNEFYRRAFLYYAGVMTTLGLGFVAFAGELLAFLVPEGYQEGYAIIPWLIGAHIVYGSGSFTNMGMVVSKKTMGISVAAWCGTAVNVAMSVLFIRHFGWRGAGIGAFLAAVTFTGILWWFTMRVSDVRYDTIRLAGVLGCYIAASAAVLALRVVVADPVLSVLLRSGVFLTSAAVVLGLTTDRAARKSLKALLPVSFCAVDSRNARRPGIPFRLQTLVRRRSRWQRAERSSRGTSPACDPPVEDADVNDL